MASNEVLTEEQRIEKKAKLFKFISKILIVVSVIAIAVFIFFAMGTKKNIDTKTAMDTQKMRSNLKKVISLQKRYFEENGSYIQIKPGQLCRELPQYDPDVEGYFTYEFDPQTGVATGREREDSNGDGDINDALELSVDWDAKVPSGSSFFWPDDDKADFEQRKASLTTK
jgi:hypothetical protein